MRQREQDGASNHTPGGQDLGDLAKHSAARFQPPVRVKDALKVIHGAVHSGGRAIASVSMREGVCVSFGSGDPSQPEDVD